MSIKPSTPSGPIPTPLSFQQTKTVHLWSDAAIYCLLSNDPYKQELLQNIGPLQGLSTQDMSLLHIPTIALSITSPKSINLTILVILLFLPITECVSACHLQPILQSLPSHIKDIISLPSFTPSPFPLSNTLFATIDISFLYNMPHTYRLSVYDKFLSGSPPPPTLFLPSFNHFILTHNLL